MRKFMGLLLIIPALLMGQAGVLSKYTFVPGEKIVFSEDFEQTALGQVPESIDVNGDGEVVSVDGEKWFKMSNGTKLTVPVEQKIKDLTVEFYLKARKISSNQFTLNFINEEKEYSSRIAIYSDGLNWIGEHGEKELPNNTITKQLYGENQKSHVAIIVQGKMTKVFVNQIQVMSVTNFFPVLPDKIEIIAGEPEEEDGLIAIKDIKIANEIPQIATQLKKGKYVAYGIYFDIASDVIKQESYYVLKEIAEALKANPKLKVTVVGHTDSSGSNKVKQQKLSKMRSESVKKYLVATFGVSEANIDTDGKGDTEPVADNSSAKGRALNRRVEFITKK